MNDHSVAEYNRRKNVKPTADASGFSAICILCVLVKLSGVLVRVSLRTSPQSHGAHTESRRRRQTRALTEGARNFCDEVTWCKLAKIALRTQEPKMFPRFITKSILVLIVISFLAIMLPRQTQACGPFFQDAIFVFEKHPDFPLERFARGQLGVLQPTYARSYLVAAYRNLSGERLSDVEVTALKALWEERINLSYAESSD